MVWSLRFRFVHRPVLTPLPEARDFRESDAATRQRNHQELQTAFQMADTQLKSGETHDIPCSAYVKTALTSAAMQATRGGLGKVQQAIAHASSSHETARRVVAWIDEDLVQSETFPRAAPGTCSWFAEHRAYQEWTQDGRSRPLWVHGMSGKLDD